MGFHLLFSRAEIEFKMEMETNFIKFQSMRSFLQCEFHSSQLYSSVRSVEQLTVDFQARLEALEEQKNLEECDTGL